MGDQSKQGSCNRQCLLQPSETPQHSDQITIPLCDAATEPIAGLMHIHLFHHPCAARVHEDLWSCSCLLLLGVPGWRLSFARYSYTNDAPCRTGGSCYNSECSQPPRLLLRGQANTSRTSCCWLPARLALGTHRAQGEQ